METKAEDTGYLLTADDRCDACSAQAYVYVKLEPGDLLFCLHHWNLNSFAIAPSAIEIIDESARLLAR